MVKHEGRGKLINITVIDRTYSIMLDSRLDKDSINFRKNLSLLKA